MLSDLSTFFEQFEIPQVEKREKTFLEISQQPHYENVLSNIYAFFFRVTEEHGFQDLFLSTLKSFIDERIEGKKFDELDDPYVETEKHTKKGGRIDLLIHNKQGTIIIENKVYHTLNNDLDDYWTSVAAASDRHKVGIILSLFPIDRSQYANYKSAEHYFNLTHLELMERVMDNVERYREGTSPKFGVFLEDFYQNIKNLSESSMNATDLQFYLEHRKPIHDAARLKWKFKDYVKSEAARVNQLLKKDLELSNTQLKERLVYYVSKVNKDLMFTLIFEDLFDGKNQLHLFIELTGQAKSTLQEHPNLYQGNESTNAFLLNKFASATGYWAHFAYHHLKLTDSELLILSRSIADHVNASPLFQIFNTLEEALKPSTT